MALSRSITSLVVDPLGQVTQDFLTHSQKGWADLHMQLRYGAAPPLAEDPADHPAVLCHNHLRNEYTAIRSWFDSSGKLVPLLMSKHLAKELSGPLGNGISWDFKASGDPEPLMMQFKATLIACRRTWESKANQGGKELDSGSLMMGGLARLARSAFAARAEIHNWHEITEKKVSVTGAELARRWIATQTFVFLLRAGAQEDWAWSTSKAREVFGSIDTDRAPTPATD